LNRKFKRNLSGQTAREAARDAVIAAELRPRVLVIGYGNSLRSDDGIGCRVARELQSRLDGPRVEVIECRQLAPEMAEKIRGAALVIFVDAAAEGSPGEWRHHRLHAEDASPTFSHAPAPAALLALAADLYGAAPEGHLFTVCGSSFGYGEDFSPDVARALPSVVSEIELLLGRERSGISVG
jgi:hydrogenase maturation protease